ncbi:hypothetical protein EDC04DRAFT_2602462 [Pisolithus marmoratus]|nr:hypothetical protein EDC04DRAFT_2602462 [Pisolithus marmoratus]
MAARQTQDGTRQEKPIRPKPWPQSAGQSKGGDEAETKLNAAREINEEQSEIGLKARERTILKLRRVIEQAHKKVGMEAKLGTVKDIDHEQPRRDKTVSKQKDTMKQGGTPASIAVLSAHASSGTCEKNAASKCILSEVKTGIEGRVKNWNDVVLTPVSENPRQWGFSDLDLPTPRQGQDDEEPNVILQCPSLTAGTIYKDPHCNHH